MNSPYQPLKVYLAAPFEQRESMLCLKDLLVSYGIVVTSTWLTPADGNENNMATMGSKFHECRMRAVKDMEDIRQADYFILYKPKELHRVPTTGGHHVELGFCLGIGKPIIILGARENVFNYLPGIQVVTTEQDLLETLNVPV